MSSVSNAGKQGWSKKTSKEEAGSTPTTPQIEIMQESSDSEVEQRDHIFSRAQENITGMTNAVVSIVIKSQFSNGTLLGYVIAMGAVAFSKQSYIGVLYICSLFPIVFFVSMWHLYFRRKTELYPDIISRVVLWSVISVNFFLLGEVIVAKDPDPNAKYKPLKESSIFWIILVGLMYMLISLILLKDDPKPKKGWIFKCFGILPVSDLAYSRIFTTIWIVRMWLASIIVGGLKNIGTILVKDSGLTVGHKAFIIAFACSAVCMEFYKNLFAASIQLIPECKNNRMMIVYMTAISAAGFTFYTPTELVYHNTNANLFQNGHIYWVILRSFLRVPGNMMYSMIVALGFCVGDSQDKTKFGHGLMIVVFFLFGSGLHGFNDWIIEWNERSQFMHKYLTILCGFGVDCLGYVSLFLLSRVLFPKWMDRSNTSEQEREVEMEARN